MVTEVTRREAASFEQNAPIKDPAEVLPPEIVFNIFSYLNLLSLAACRKVSKQWRVFASTPTVWKACKDNDVELEWGLGGMLDAINIIKETILKPRLMKEEYKRPGTPQVKGLLLYGPSGTGKTRFTYKLQELFGCRDFYCRRVNAAPSVNQRYSTFTEWHNSERARIHLWFERARKVWEELKDQSPFNLIIIDEIDYILNTSSNSCQWKDRVLSQLLCEMEDLHQRDNILVIGITNRLFTHLDPRAFLPERFELRIKFDIPTPSARTKILEIFLCKFLENDALNENIDFSKIVEMTQGFTGRVIKKLVQKTSEANLQRINKLDKNSIDYRNMSKISWEDFQEGFRPHEV